MAEVEDVPGPAAGAAQHVVHALEQALARREEQRRVEVALQRRRRRRASRRASSSGVRQSTPITLPPASRCARQQVAGAGAEVDLRHVEVGERVEDAPDVRQHVLAVVGLVERADPGVEELQRLGARLDLRAQVVGDDVGEQPGQPVPARGVAVHEGLGLGEVARAAALDRVGGEREGRAREADERHAQLAAQQADRLEHGLAAPRAARSAGALRRRPPQRTGFSITGPSPAWKSNGIPSGASGTSRSENRIAASSGKARTGCSVTSTASSGVRHQLEQRVLLAQRAVLRHVAARLAHEPDGRAVDGLAPTGPEKAIAVAHEAPV